MPCAMLPLSPAVRLMQASVAGAFAGNKWVVLMADSIRCRLLIALGLALAPSAALADAIDGDWCAADGQHMTIRGEDITTPGGQAIKGRYDRHGFDYVVPPGESGAGEAVTILLRGEYLAVSRQGPASAPLKEWRRCANRTS